MFPMFIVFTLLLLFIPSQALAWGPGVHLALGNHVLSHLPQLGSTLAALLTAHADHFLYGCLSADIFIGKGCKFKPTHSHNWETGKKLLRQADTPEVQAYAYGYLSHLAADVIAHNYLVPNILGYSAGRGKLSHTYVEMLADLQVDWPRKQGSRLFDVAQPHLDQALITTLGHKQLPFRIKKQIFRHSLHLIEERAYKRSLHLVRDLLPGTRKKELIQKSISFAQTLVMDLLKDPLHSPVLECDPIGSSNLIQIRHFRRKQRSYYDRHVQGIIFPLDPRLQFCLQPPGDFHAHFSQLSA